MNDLDTYILDHHLAMKTCLEEISTINRLIKHVEEIAAEHPGRNCMWIIDKLRHIAVEDRDHGWVDEARRKTSVIRWVSADVRSPERAEFGYVPDTVAEGRVIIDSLRAYRAKQEERWFELDAELGRSLAHQYVDRHNINLVPLLEKVETEGGDA